MPKLIYPVHSGLLILNHHNKKNSHLNDVIYTSMTKILKWVVVQVVSVKGTPNV